MTISLPTHAISDTLKRNHQKAKWKTTFLQVSMPKKFCNFLKIPMFKSHSPLSCEAFFKTLAK